MLTIETKHRIADWLGDSLGRFLHAIWHLTTVPLPRNGRNHVRTRGFLGFVTHTRSYHVHGLALNLETINLEMMAREAIQFFDLLEPETFAWMEEGVRDGKVVWDIGANLGLYSLWCAKRFPTAQIYAFEPNALTYPILVRHVIANGVTDQVRALPVALGPGPAGISAFRLSTLVPGMAYNQLAVSAAPPMWQGREAARYSVLAASADELVERFGVAPPNHIKLDVDGIEPLILAGARTVLSRVQSVLVEVVDECVCHHADGAEAIYRPLREAGLVEDESFRGRGSGRNRVFRRR